MLTRGSVKSKFLQLVILPRIKNQAEQKNASVAMVIARQPLPDKICHCWVADCHDLTTNHENSSAWIHLPGFIPHRLACFPSHDYVALFLQLVFFS
jgi:hypothetical protein